jgi:peptide/nickel transport system substrate-binding protein
MSMSRRIPGPFLLIVVVIALAGCAAPAPQAQVAAPTVMPVEDAATAPPEEIVAPAADASPTDSPAAGAASGAILVRAITSEPAQVDPQGAPSSGLSIVLPYLFDTLVVRDLDNSLVPALAESWEVSEDGKTITMKLRPDVVFHDGTPLNAEAVKFTFERFKAEGKASPIYAGVQQIAGIEAVDERNVRFTFGAPAANFWSTISMPYAGIISPASVQSVSENGEGFLVGSGPFRLAEWQSGQSITLEKNSDYTWGPAVVENRGVPHLDKLVFKVIPDAATQLAALEAGEVDVIFINNPAHRAKLEKNPDVRLEETVLNSLIYLGFNNQKAPFDDVKVRQALSHAINKDQIVEVALGGLGIAAYAPLPPTLPGFDPALKANELGYDVEKAMALLTDAGFEPGSDGAWSRDGQPLRTVLLTSNRPPNDAVATVIQSQLQEIGVPVEIQQLDSKAVMEAANAGQFDLLLWRYDWNDPDALSIFLGSDRIGATNRVAYGNPDLDVLLAQGALELDAKKRDQIYLEAQKLIMADAPWQAIYNPIDLMAISKRVDGAEIGYMGRVLVNDARIMEK